MILGLLLMSLWLNDSAASYNRPHGGAPAYLSGADVRRWEQLRVLKMLYRGNHRGYFLTEGRTQFNYPEEEIEGRLVKRYLTYNLCKLISHTTADLMFGAKVELDAPTPQQTAKLDELARNSLLHARFHSAVVQMSWSGGGFVEATTWNGNPFVEVLPPDEMYPQGRPMPDGQYRSYVRYATDTVFRDNKLQTLLLKTAYLAGEIRRELRTLGDDGRVGAALELAQWPAYADGQAVPPPVQATGLDRPSVVYLANVVGECVGISDYDGLIELQDAVNGKYAQFARVIAKHSDPKIHFPTEAANPQGNVPATHDAFYGATAPEYIVWNPQLDAAYKDREANVLAFCTAAEMSPVLLGIRQGATPDAARKLRLEATKDLAKTGRKSLIVEPAIAMVIELAQRLDQSTPLLRSYPIDSVGVHMRDGLPVDGQDLAAEAATWRAAELLSLEGGVAMRIEDPAAAKVEVELIKKEAAAKLPTVFAPLGGGPNEPGVPPVTNDRGQQEGAVAA
jgi:hypothetical protein